MVIMTHQPISMPRDLFYNFKKALKGTRFENAMSESINASAAIRELMESVINERNKKEAIVTQQELPASGILDTTDEYVTKVINKFLEIKPEVTDEVISKMELEKQGKIYNYYNYLNKNIIDRHSQTKQTIEEPKGRVATEYEEQLWKDYKSGKTGGIVTSQLRKLHREIEEGLVIIQ